MAVAFDAVTESHTGTTGSTSQASFTWTHTPVGTPAGVLVFTFVNANANDATSVTYGGVSMTQVSGGRAVDTATEAGDCEAWFLGAAIPTGAQSVVVNRTNNADVMYAAAITVTAAANTEVAGVTLQQENQAPAQVSVDDGSTGVNSVRFAGANYGGSAVPIAGAASTALIGIDFGVRTIGVVRETTAGQGARNVGFADASDDWACVLLAVREAVAQTVSPSGVASAEAFGADQLNLGLSGFGNIASAEAFGADQVNLTLLTVGGLASDETFGSDQLNLTLLSVGGLASDEVFGAHTISASGGAQTVTATGIASDEAFGADQVNLTLVSVGALASDEAFGAVTVTPGGVMVTATGIASGEAFGTDQLNLGLSGFGGIASGEAFGADQLNLTLYGAGAIATAESFGADQVNLTLAAAGIASDEAFGNAAVTPGGVIVSPAGIGSDETFGAALILPGAVTVIATSIASEEAFGSYQLNLTLVSVGGLASTETFGTDQINLTLTGVGAIVTAEAFGIALAQLGLSTDPRYVAPDAIRAFTAADALRALTADDPGRTFIAPEPQ